MRLRLLGLTSLAFLLSFAPSAAGTARIDGPTGRFLSQPDIAIDGSNPARLLVVSRDISVDGFEQIDAFRSSNGGTTFDGGPVLSERFLGTLADGSDPATAFDRSGRAYLGEAVWRFPQAGVFSRRRGRSAHVPSATQFESLLAVQRSDDGGAAFGAPSVLARSSNFGLPGSIGSPPPAGSTTHSKERIAVDRTGGPRDGTVYVAWSVVKSGRDQRRARAAIARSGDAGATFSPPVLVSPGGRLATGPQVTVQPDGAVQVAWASFRRDRRDREAAVLAATSRDGGASFSAPARVARFANGRAAYRLVALDSSTAGTLLACWAQGPRRDRSQTVCARSADGRRWAAPVAVALWVGGRHDQVAVASDVAERFWVLFYSLTKSRTKVLLSRSDDGGASFAPPLQLDRRDHAPKLFVGDHQGLDAFGGRVAAAWVLPRAGPGSANSIYVSVVGG